MPGSSVQWGAWSGVGMVASNKAVLARMQRGGISSVTPAAGLAVLSTLLSRRTPPAAQVWPDIKNDPKINILYTTLTLKYIKCCTHGGNAAPTLG